MTTVPHLPRACRLPTRCAAHRQALASVTALLTVAAACGSDEGDAPGAEASTAARTAQGPIDEAAWQAEVAADAALAALAQAVGAPWRAAGVIEAADGTRSVWAEFAADVDGPRGAAVAVFRVCDAKGACSHGKGSYDQHGAALVDDKGAPLAKLGVGAPVLAKRLLEHNLQKAATVLVAAPLKSTDPLEPVSARAAADQVAWGKRICWIVSAYGPAVGADLAQLRAAAESTGLFDAVEVLHFVRRRDLVERLPLMTPLDTVIWLGAGVVDTFTDGKPSKSIGMTVSRGVLGDELIHRDSVKGLFDLAPAGGPGLMVLAGSDSLTTDHGGQTGLLAQALLAVPLRPVVGFDGAVTVASAEAGVAALLASLAKGDSLALAVAAGTKAARGATAKGGDVEMLTLLDGTLAAEWRLPAKSSALPAGKAQLRLYLKLTPSCVEPVATCDVSSFKAGVKVPSQQLTASSTVFDCDLTLAGRWFSCEKVNPTTGTNFRLRGLLTGGSKGDTVVVAAEGDPDSKARNLTMFGVGRVETVDVGGGSTRVRFDGDAAASLYLDAEGRCCFAVSPSLSGQKVPDQWSEFVFKP